MTTRRQALTRIGLLAAAAGAGLRAGETSQAPAPPAAALPADDSPLDEALSRIHAEEPRGRQGLSTHAPMAAEALCALGRADRVGAWVTRYDRPSLPLPARVTPIAAERWREALGPRREAATWEEANARWRDWVDFFEAEMAASPWERLLDLWAGRLAPGMSGAATHGVIRTAHAARGLARRDTPPRRAELARALAYWASSYEELPSATAAPPFAKSFADALGEVPLYRKAFGHSPEGRNIVEQLRHLAELPSFGPIRDRLAAPADLSGALSALTATFARVYLRHGTREHTIPFVHAVTGPAALRRLAPHLSGTTARAAFPFAWQTAAAVYAAYAPEHDPASLTRRAESSRLAAEELAARAVANGDEHAIKFTEVMLAEHRAHPDPIYLAAAEDVTRRLA